MYIPRHFEINKRDESFAFIEANAFGQLISTVEGRHFSSHLPFLINEDKTKIIGHVARQNPQHRDIAGQEVLLTFSGPHDYISPSWYSGPGVPTWNYQAVHVYGRARVFDDTNELRGVVETLTHKYESRFDQPWQPNYDVAMLGAIIGIEISISEVQCKYKLSQNRSAQDQFQVIEKLKSLGSSKLAEAMARNEKI